jgi:hypothetical protein
MADSSVILTAEPSVPESPAPDFATISLALLPLIAFLLILIWGKKRAKRKKMAVEMSYNLIALELLAFLMLPICEQPFDCAFWAAIPILMFAALLSFIYHSARREAHHHLRVAKAMSEGHIDNSSLLQGEIEQNMPWEPKPESREQRETKEQTKEQTKEHFPSKKEHSPEDHEHIEKTLDGVLKKSSGKKGKKKKKSKKD